MRKLKEKLVAVGLFPVFCLGVVISSFRWIQHRQHSVFSEVISFLIDPIGPFQQFQDYELISEKVQSRFFWMFGKKAKKETKMFEMISSKYNFNIWLTEKKENFPNFLYIKRQICWVIRWKKNKLCSVKLKMEECFWFSLVVK